MRGQGPGLPRGPAPGSSQLPVEEAGSGWDLNSTSWMAFSGHATTQRPHAWHASACGVYDVLRPCTMLRNFPNTDSWAKSLSSMRRTSKTPYGQTSTQSRFPSHRSRATTGLKCPGSARHFSPGRSGCVAARRAFSLFGDPGTWLHSSVRDVSPSYDGSALTGTGVGALHSGGMRLVRWLLLPVLFCALPTKAEEPTVRLAPGEQRVLDFPGIRRVAVAAPDVADVKVIGKTQLLVIAQSRGRTSLTVWTDKQQLQRTLVVELPRAEELSRELKALGFSGLEVRTIGERVVVDGHVESLQDMRTLRSLVGGLSYVSLLVRVDAQVIQAALTHTAEQINTALKRNGIVNARAVVVGQRILLEGSVSDEAERDKAQRIADSFYEEVREALGSH